MVLVVVASATPSSAQDEVPAVAQVVGWDPSVIALDHLVANHAELGLAANDVADVVVADVAFSSVAGTTIIYLQQRHGGVPVVGAIAAIAVDHANVVRSVASRFTHGLGTQKRPEKPRVPADEAKIAAAQAVGLLPERAARPQVLEAAPDVPSKLVLQGTDTGELRQAWEVVVGDGGDEGLWVVRVDAENGRELERSSLVAHDSYTVYAEPLEGPTYGSRDVIVDPADPVASPFGWHDTNGIAGPESSLTIGNNVSAYTDLDGDNLPDAGSQPDGGPTLDFSFPLDLGFGPATYRDADVASLFFWTNYTHDVFYRFGFDEANGNFQFDNYGWGGIAGDPVLAEAQDGSSLNTASFATPPDGFSPRMQSFIFDAGTPDRSGSLDNSVVVHEYSHGISNRLTGGPSNVSCLQNAEQAGEGWSDYFALMLTMAPGASGPEPRPFATYALGQPPSGPGLRDYPYSTSFGTDPRTYDEIKTASIPHGVGSTFAAMLWEMTWKLIDRDGLDTDLVNGTGGNVTALQLVVDGLKLQPCSPGFVDSRDAILLADSLSNGGTNHCLIWSAFADRGLGWSASQGSPLSRTDGTQAFDLPPACQPLALTMNVAPENPGPGDVVTYSLVVANNADAPLTGVEVADTIPVGTTYVPSSADCGGSLVGSEVVFPIGLVASGASLTCSFAVVVDNGPGTQMIFFDDFESGSASWTIDHAVGSVDWVLTSAAAVSPTNAFFADNVNELTDQRLTLAAPVSAMTALRFWHSYDTEVPYDGGVVEVSSDGLTWVDVGAVWSENGYDSTLAIGSNPLSGRLVFSGDSGGFIESVADLSSFAGSDIQVRFRFGSDSGVGGGGWYIDDVRIADEVLISNAATANSAEGSTSSAVVVTLVAPGPIASPECDGRVVTVDLAQGQVPTSGDDVILGTSGDDVIDAGPGNDVVCGGDGADEIDGGEGHDLIFGGDGDDDLDGQEGGDQLFGEAGDDVLDGGADPDYLDGGVDNDTLEGGVGADQLIGGDGADLLLGGDGPDQLFGFDGADTLWGENPGETSGEPDYLWGGLGVDEYHGGPGNDWLEGGEEAEVMNGDSGDDILLGHGGDDVLNGGDGMDYLWGGSGVDTFNGGDDRDTLDGADGGEDSGEVMNGDGGDDLVIGWGGDDILNGGSGSDYLWGGAGVDTFHGGDDADYLDGANDGGLVGADLSESETMNGGGGDDQVIGWGGDDTLDGAAGVDYLWGGAGIDNLIGGDGDGDVCDDPDGGNYDLTCEVNLP
jgi:uncharacterized repeat protein (TIGR01451 family)